MALFGNGHGGGDAARLVTGLYRGGMAAAVALLGWLAAHQFGEIKQAIRDAAIDAKAAAAAATQARAELDKRAAEIAGHVDSVAVAVEGHERRIERLESWRDGARERR